MAYWYRRVFLLAIPLILSNLTQPLLSTVDTILSGHLPGAAALGGVAIGGIFFNSVFWTFGFLRLSTTGLVAQAHGAQEVVERFPHARLIVHNEDDRGCLGKRRVHGAPPLETGNVKWKVTPGPSLGVIQRRPPWASMIE